MEGLRFGEFVWLFPRDGDNFEIGSLRSPSGHISKRFVSTLSFPMRADLAFFMGEGVDKAAAGLLSASISPRNKAAC